MQHQQRYSGRQVTDEYMTRLEKKMSAGSSSASGATTGGDSSRRRGGIITGIPKRCWCGDEIVPLMSKSVPNPYRRYFRCGYAARKRLENDNHIFKWIDEALINEIETLEFKTMRLEQEMKEIERKEMLVAERVQMEVEKKLFDRVEDVLAETKGRMKRMMVIPIIGCVVLIGIMEVYRKAW